MASFVYSHLYLPFEGWGSLIMNVTIHFCMCMSFLFMCTLTSLFTIILEAQKTGETLGTWVTDRCEPPNRCSRQPSHRARLSTRFWKAPYFLPLLSRHWRCLEILNGEIWGVGIEELHMCTCCLSLYSSGRVDRVKLLCRDLFSSGCLECLGCFLKEKPELAYHLDFLVSFQCLYSSQLRVIYF